MAKTPATTTVKNRKSGYYWVRFSEDNGAEVSHKEWAPAKWDGRNWWIIGHSSPTQVEEGTDIRVVGDMILPPRRMAKIEKMTKEMRRHERLFANGWSGKKETQ